MNASKLIDDVYANLTPQLPPDLNTTLKFHTHEEHKNGMLCTDGRILGKQAGKVWDRRWCYYSLNFGPDRNNTNRIGGVGFGCAVEQKTCGGGQHKSTLLEIADSFCEAHSKFHYDLGGSWWLSIATPYTPSSCGFPVVQAAQDLAILIVGTFAAINDLVV